MGYSWKDSATAEVRRPSDEKEYRAITCLNTCYKIFTGNVGSYMKEHTERNSIWDRSQLGTCSAVLGTVDQLIVDNTIMNQLGFIYSKIIDF